MVVDTAKEIRLGDLARELKGKLTGDPETIIKDIKSIEEAGEGDLAFIFSKKTAASLDNTKASCVVVPGNVTKPDAPLIICENPNLAFKKAVELIIGRPATKTGIHKTACVDKDVYLGKGVSLGAYAVLEDGVRVGDGTTIKSNTYIGRHARIGENCIIHPQVTIHEHSQIGSRVTIHSGTIIGADGFGYELTAKGHEKIPQIGNVIIEDDVEIGACVTIDRAKIAHTHIGSGTKIDNLVQVAHNVTIGKNCIIVAQCGISGSVKIGNNVMIGGKVGIADHIEIGDNVMVAAHAGIMKSVPPNTIMWGLPARPLKKAKKIYAIFDKLPEIYERLKKLEQK